MSTTLLLAGAFLAQSVPSITVTGFEGAKVRSEVAYVEVARDEMVAGENAQAIARINANHAADLDDPAKMINLGTAHARMGDAAAAEGYYRAAINSRSRYELELTDGRWMDSRRAAKLAIQGLAKGQALAAR